MSTPRLRLGQLLVDAKMITEEDLQEVLALQKSQKSMQASEVKRLGALLVERGLINETQLTQILSHQLSVPWVSLLHIEFSRQLLNLVPHDVAERYCLVPIYVRHVRHQGETLYVAMDDPTNEDGLRACREHSGLPVRAMIAPPSDIRSAIRVYYGVKSAPPRPSAPEVPQVGSGPVTAESPQAASTTDARATVPDLPMSVEYRPEGPQEEAPAAEAPAEAAAEAPADATAEVPTEAAAPEEEAPVIEVSTPVSSPSTWRGGATPAERLRGVLQVSGSSPPPSTREVETIPKPRGRAPRMVALTLLDGTTINLPAAKKRGRQTESEPAGEVAAPAPEVPAEPVSTEEAVEAADATEAPEAPKPSEGSSEPPPKGEEEALGLTARDLVLALRAVSHGADASEVLGSNVRWEAMFAALLSLMLKKHLIADWEFVDELKKTM